jgi:PucR C-terminal helix-turn-helix domain
MPVQSAEPEVTQAIQDLVDRLEGRIDTIVDKMVVAYAEHVPSYRNPPPDVAQDIREGARASIVVGAGILRGVVTGEALQQPLRELGKRRAAQGLPLHDVINAFMIGTRTFWEEVITEAPSDPAERTQVLSRLMLATLDLLHNAAATVSAGYREVDAIKIADEEHDHRTIVEMMAGIRQPDAQHADRAARRGIALDATRWCLVTSPEGSGGTFVHDLRSRFPEAPVARSGRFLIAFLPGEKPPSAIDGCRCGIARAVDPAAGYRRARSAHKVARHTNSDVVLYDDVVPLALLLDTLPEERHAFVEAQLGPALEDPLGEELIASLEAFYAAGQSVAAASRELHVHRHTLEYRLGRLETLLGRDIRDTQPRLLLEFAMALRKMPDSGAP